MAATLSVPESMAERVRDFVRAEGIPLEVVSGRSATVEVAESAERRPCVAGTLYAGGWISCAVAWSTARELGVERASFGRLLDALDIKIRECQLGCF